MLIRGYASQVTPQFQNMLGKKKLAVVNACFCSQGFTTKQGFSCGLMNKKPALKERVNCLKKRFVYSDFLQ